jgi:hypothetical protein
MQVTDSTGRIKTTDVTTIWYANIDSINTLKSLIADIQDTIKIDTTGFNALPLEIWAALEQDTTKLTNKYFRITRSNCFTCPKVEYRIRYRDADKATYTEFNYIDND